MAFDFTKEPGKQLEKREANDSYPPLVTVITPFFNSGKYIEQTFNSVMNQTFPWFEWIIVNDGSTNADDLDKLINLSKTDKRIQILNKNNGGISSARNMAISASTTEIIVSLDADDLIDPTYLECCYFALETNPGASWCYTDTIGFGNFQYEWIKPFDSELMKKENFLVEVAMMRKAAILNVGGYDETEKHFYEDWHLWLKFLRAGMYPIHLGFFGAWYRRLDTGVLGILHQNKEKHDKAMVLINEVGAEIQEKINAIEFPRHNKPNFINKNSKIKWERTIKKTESQNKVLMLLPWMNMGGADKFVLDVVKKCDKSKFEFSIITTNPLEYVWRQDFESHVRDVFDLSSFLDPSNWPMFIHYLIKTRDIKILFISNSYYGYYLIPWLRKEFPELAIIDYVHMEEWYWRNGGYARTSGVMGDILEKTYVCNEKTRQVMINSFGRLADSVETLYIGVDHKYYDEQNVEYGIVKRQLGIEEQRPMVLFPCRMHPQKRPFLMLEIAKELKKRKMDIAIVAVGDGPQLVEMKNKVEEWGLKKTVYFAGMQQEMRPYYKDAAITLICSLKEGLALTAYESLSMRRPVISSDVGGQGELIDEQVGALIPLMQSESSELDSREFAAAEVGQYVEAINEILGDQARYETMKKACRERIEKQFSVELMVHRLETIFLNYINNPVHGLARKSVHDKLLSVPNFVDEVFTLYNAFEGMFKETEEVWKSREWFRTLYENKNADKAKYLDNIEQTEASKRLEEIYKMKSWKIIEKYQYFMDNTKFGRVMKKLRGTISGK